MSQKNRTGGGAPKVPPSKPKPAAKKKPAKSKRKRKPAEEEAVVSRSNRVRSTSRGGRGR